MKSELYAGSYRYKGASFFPQDLLDETREVFAPVLQMFKAEQTGPDSWRLTAENAGWTYVKVAYNDTHRNWEIAVERTTNPDQDVIDALIERFRDQMGWK